MCIDTCPQNQPLPFQPLHYHGQDHRAVKGRWGQDRPSGVGYKTLMGYKTISEALGEKVTTVTVIIPTQN